jgi:DNA-binding NarL/FixJ family response regulator
MPKQEKKSNKKINSVLLADTNAFFRRDFEAAFEDKKFVHYLGSVGNNTELYSYLDANSPDLILLDIHIPIVHGLSFFQKINEKSPDAKVIILYSSSDSLVFFKMMDPYVYRYIPKEIGMEAIYKIIKQIDNTELHSKLTIGSYNNPALFKKLVTQPVINGSSRLTERELQVLVLICDEKTTKEIATILYLSHRTVEAVRDKLKYKTGSKTLAGLVLFAVKRGLVLV